MVYLMEGGTGIGERGIEKKMGKKLLVSLIVVVRCGTLASKSRKGRFNEMQNDRPRYKDLGSRIRSNKDFTLIWV